MPNKKNGSSAKKATKAKVKAKRVYWEDLTPKQQAQYRLELSKAKEKARRDIAAGGRTLLRTTSDGWNIYAANDYLDLNITQQCIDKAVCSSKGECVVAQAIKRQIPFATGWAVGSNIVIITCDATKEVIRYGTSGPLAHAIPVFDRPPYVWNLKPGTYRLKPLPVSYRIGTRWIMYKGTGGKRSTFKGTEKSPTREGKYHSLIRK
ncbi:hypothetical protein EBZ39_13895 [bacterium]|nr:hypothetical protein [bacterium]